MHSLSMISQLKPPQLKLMEKLGMMLIHESSSLDSGCNESDPTIEWDAAESIELGKILKSKKPIDRNLASIAEKTM